MVPHCSASPRPDSFLSTKWLGAIIQEECSLWITHVESAFGDPGFRIAEAKEEQRVTAGLLIKLLSDEESIKYIKSNLHMWVTLIQNLCKAGARQPASVRNRFLEDYQRND